MSRRWIRGGCCDGIWMGAGFALLASTYTARTHEGTASSAFGQLSAPPVKRSALVQPGMRS